MQTRKQKERYQRYILEQQQKSLFGGYIVILNKTCLSNMQNFSMGLIFNYYLNPTKLIYDKLTKHSYKPSALSIIILIVSYRKVMQAYGGTMQYILNEAESSYTNASG